MVNSLRDQWLARQTDMLRFTYVFSRLSAPRSATSVWFSQLSNSPLRRPPGVVQSDPGDSTYLLMALDIIVRSWDEGARDARLQQTRLV